MCVYKCVCVCVLALGICALIISFCVSVFGFPKLRPNGYQDFLLTVFAGN